MVIVYHNPEKNWSMRPPAPAKETLVEVARIDTSSQPFDNEIGCLEVAYHETQNISGSWTKNKNVITLLTEARSTSVGDVMEVDGRFYIVHGFGFKEVYN